MIKRTKTWPGSGVSGPIWQAQGKEGGDLHIGVKPKVAGKENLTEEGTARGVECCLSLGLLKAEWKRPVCRSLIWELIVRSWSEGPRKRKMEKERHAKMH